MASDAATTAKASPLVVARARDGVFTPERLQCGRLEARQPAKESPAKPTSVMAQVEGSGASIGSALFVGQVVKIVGGEGVGGGSRMLSADSVPALSKLPESTQPSHW